MDAILKLGWVQTCGWREAIETVRREIDAGTVSSLEGDGELRRTVPDGQLVLIVRLPDEDADKPAEGWEMRTERILGEIEAGRFEAEQEPDALAFITSLGDIVCAANDGSVI